MTRVDGGKGRLFSPDSKEARICRWRVEGWNLFLADDLGEVCLDLSKAELSLGGFNEDQIVLKHQGFSFYAPRQELEKELLPLGLEKLRGSLRREQQRVRRSVRLSWVLAAVAGCMILMAGAAAWWVSDRMVEAAAAMSPVGWDVELGQGVWKLQSSAWNEVSDERLVKPLEKLVGDMTQPFAGQGFRFRVHVVESEEINAFALPGGEIAVFTGLLRAAKGPDEVAGVLAHEIEHVVHRHSLRKLYGQLRWQLAIAVFLGDSQELHARLLRNGPILAELSYSREMETEADMEGLKLLRQLNYPQVGMLKFFKTLENQDGNHAPNMKYLSTHPPTQERLKALEQAMDQNAKGGGLEMNWSSLQSALEKGTEHERRGQQ